MTNLNITLPPLLDYDDADTNWDVLDNRVKRGVVAVDAVAPPQWREAIDLRTLDMANFTDCVFGQLERNFGSAVGDALTELGDDGLRYPSTLGFDFVSEMDWDDNEGMSAAVQHRVLHDLWVAAIEKENP